MPLPAALLARLAKRGIVDKEETPAGSVTDVKKPGEEEEEVFAEDYDDPSKPEPIPEPEVTVLRPAPGLAPPPPQQIMTESTEESPFFFETTSCPNRSNPYHECLAYCRRKYGMKEWNPDPDMIRRRDRMLNKYPLPVNWVEVGDFDTNRFYYWNVNTNEVSWLSPTHPKAQFSPSAESLGVIGKVGDLDSDGEAIEEESHKEEEEVLSESGSDTSLSDEEDFIDKRGRVRNTPRFADAKKGRQKDDLDPMDPASYSDIPRGGWSEGLDQRGKAKTGVDVTATGPLFQQRPYPSPGDILRANQSIKKKK